MRAIFILALLVGCSSYDSRTYYMGIRDGSYSGCVYVLDSQGSTFSNDEMKPCREVYDNWNNYIIKNFK